MKEEIQRITRLVQEGKLSPEDAAELIEAFAKADTSAPPPPPPPKDPLKDIFGSIEKGFKGIDWKEISGGIEEGAKKGFEAIRTGIDDLSKGKVNFGLFANEERREVSLPLNVPADKRLRVENPCGDVRILGRTDTGTVLAQAHLRGATAEEAKTRAQEYTVIIEESESLVVIRQPDVPGLAVDLTIRLPEAAHIEVRTEMGDVSILDHPAGVRVTSRSGDVKVRGASGPVEISADSGEIVVEDAESPSVALDTKSGNLTIARVRGNVNARTAAGDISLTESSGKVVSLESVSGDVRVDLIEPVIGSVNVRTVSGDVSVEVPDGGDCRVSLSSLRGDVASELNLQDEARAEGRRTGRLGSGTGTLDISAVTGDVHLKMRSASAV